MSGLDELFDPYFASIGLEGRPFALRGRQYEGEWHGRTLSVNISRRSRTRYVGRIHYRHYVGHRLNVNLGTALQTRLIIFAPTALTSLVSKTNRLFGLKRLSGLPDTLARLEIWAADAVWAQNFLADEAVQAHVARFFPADALPSSVGLNLQPGNWLFSQRAPLADMPPEVLAAWLESLLALAEAAEAAPPPLEKSELTWMEQMGKERPWLLGCGGMGLLFAVFILCGVCFTAFLLLVSLGMAGG